MTERTRRTALLPTDRPARPPAPPRDTEPAATLTVDRAPVTLSPVKRRLRERLRARAARPRPDGPVTLRPGPDRPGIVLVHPVGGSLLCYARLVAELPDCGPVLGFAADRPADDLADADRVAGLAARYLATVPGDPAQWVYAGWSFGGLVAYEMGRRTGGPAVLVDSGFPGGDLPGEPELRRIFVEDVCRTAGVPPPPPDGDADPRAVLVDAGVLTAEEGAEVAGRYPVCRSNVRALVADRPRHNPGAVRYLRAGRSPDDGPKWRAVAPALRAGQVAGADHYDLLGPRHVAAVAELLRTTRRERGTTWNS